METILRRLLNCGYLDINKAVEISQKYKIDLDEAIDLAEEMYGSVNDINQLLYAIVTLIVDNAVNKAIKYCDEIDEYELRDALLEQQYIEYSATSISDELDELISAKDKDTICEIVSEVL